MVQWGPQSRGGTCSNVSNLVTADWSPSRGRERVFSTLMYRKHLEGDLFALPVTWKPTGLHRVNILKRLKLSSTFTQSHIWCSLVKSTQSRHRRKEMCPSNPFFIVLLAPFSLIPSCGRHQKRPQFWPKINLCFRGQPAGSSGSVQLNCFRPLTWLEKCTQSQEHATRILLHKWVCSRRRERCLLQCLAAQWTKNTRAWQERGCVCWCVRVKERRTSDPVC